MSINKKKEAPYRHVEMRKEAHANFMGGPSYNITAPLLKLICMSASSFFGEPSYYKGDKPKFKKGRGGRAASTLSDRQRKYLRKTLNAIDDYKWRDMTPRTAMEKVIDEALDHDPVATLEWASTLRREEFIRATPQVILVRAAKHEKVRGTGLIRQYAPRITARADEPTVQLAYLLDEYGKPIPNALKRAWKDYLSKASDYQLAKYRMENRVVKTVDVANLAFGFGGKGQSGAVGKLLRDDLSLSGSNRTWESIISSGGKWEEAVEVMGHMALLRNIRNIVKAKVLPDRWLDKLIAGAEKGKQLPFRYLAAFNAVKDFVPGFVLDAIEQCLELSVGNLPTLNGRSLILTDNSGSAHGCPISEMSNMTVAHIGNLMGVLTGKISDEGVVGVFGDRLKEFQIRKRASIMDQTVEADRLGRRIGGGTENGIWLALDKAIRNKEHWDNIFVYSDMQAGHGGLFGLDSREYRNYLWGGGYGNRYIDVPKLVHEYRSKVNSKVNVFLVQTAGYEDTLLPEYYDRTYIIGGWSGSILKFAKRMIDTADQYQQ